MQAAAAALAEVAGGVVGMTTTDFFAAELHATRHPRAEGGSCESCFIDAELALNVLPELGFLVERSRRLVRAFDAVCVANSVLRNKLEKAGERL